jgi:hypothetical protein
MNYHVKDDVKFTEFLIKAVKSNISYHKVRGELFDMFVESVQLSSVSKKFKIPPRDYYSIIGCLSSKNAAFTDEKLLSFQTTIHSFIENFQSEPESLRDENVVE